VKALVIVLVVVALLVLLGLAMAVKSLVEIGVDKNTTVVFPAPLMTIITELGSFIAGEKAAASLARPAAGPPAAPMPAPNGKLN